MKTLFTSIAFAEAYSAPCQTSKMDTFEKIVNDLKPLFLQNATSWVFDRTQSMPLYYKHRFYFFIKIRNSL